ncbi:sigma-70 family RNA polymerase sigma factor [Amycolatopsis sp. NPDC051128]|uniref:sigma-70 family RNA polymerase sigma factor n=1 Tax=Amycolatopsis sp. NPDC051128 TaxID=3155412 RepID=UPI003431CB8D
MTSYWEPVSDDPCGADFADLFSRVGPQVRRFARARTRRMDPEDVVTETVLRLKEYLDGGSDGEPVNLVPLALRIARNLIVDHSRVRGHEVLLPVEDLIAVRTLREEDFADQSAEIIDAFDALRALPDELQEIMTLVCLNECSLFEAARILGIGVRTAQRRYQKGRERLWRTLRPRDS